MCGPCHNEMHDRDTHQLTELGMYWAGRIARQHREETQGWKDKLTTDQDGPKLSESSRS